MLTFDALTTPTPLCADVNWPLVRLQLKLTSDELTTSTLLGEDVNRISAPLLVNLQPSSNRFKKVQLAMRSKCSLLICIAEP